MVDDQGSMVLRLDLVFSPGFPIYAVHVVHSQVEITILLAFLYRTPYSSAYAPHELPQKSFPAFDSPGADQTVVRDEHRHHPNVSRSQIGRSSIDTRRDLC